ncbi:DUF3256 family protein [Prevotella sp. 10(H)]|uniref:DUF3256 family protein n=1 Tax=Prevotella sp. 10(H) TaxID=1158294 RepID=UPI0004A72A73|nr:DUF3256 family protein [Prevotella sp. 10(H)]
MKKLFFTIVLLITGITSLSAQEIKDVILSMPDDIILGLEAAQKELLISDPSDTTEITIDKGTYADIKRLAISPDFISLQTSESGTTQIKLLPLINDSKIICVVKTVCTKDSVCDSRMQFYTTKWLPINQSELFPGKDKNWFIKEGTDHNSQDFINAYTALDMNPMKIDLSPTDNNLTITYNIKSYLSEEDYKKLEPYLTEKPKILTWDKSSYK